MKRKYRNVLVGAALLVTGAILDRSFDMATEARAQTPKQLTAAVTATFRVPGGRDKMIRFEDTEYKVACYMWESGFMSCVKK